MLKAAAERGVQVKVIVYKEVDLALTCEGAEKPPFLIRRQKANSCTQWILRFVLDAVACEDHLSSNPTDSNLE